jgi:16S rRNA (adenine1518-N6/adenine1519-N6)-dimethyltransferase
LERPDYDSPSSLKKFLDSRGFAMQKKFGQNFLVNKSAREKIVSLLEAEPGEAVWEIGPGLGAMTETLLGAGVALTAFEIDKGFVEVLTELYGADPKFEVIKGDFLKTWKPRRKEAGVPARIIGNLPYNIAGAIIADFAENSLDPKKMVFTVQKESADRLRAPVGSKEYSSFSVLCRSVYKITSALDLKAGSFWPAPEVTSTVIVLEPRADFPALADRKHFLRLVRALFASRRKTIRNNLKANGIPQEAYLGALERIGVSPEARAETLSPEIIGALSDAISDILEK